MESLFYSIKIIHIVAGSLALLTGLLAIIYRNKTKTHKPFGRIYFWSMTIIFFSAVFMSVTTNNIFLFCIAFFTYYSCITAYRSLKMKKLHLDQKVHWFDWAIEVFFGLLHIGFVVFAILVLKNGNYSFGIICLVFGIIGLRGNYQTIMRFKGKLIYRNYWLLAHIGGMLGSYIGAITAFLVNNSRWVPLPNIVLWLGPTILLVPLIVIELKKYQNKAGKFNSA